MTVCSTTLWIGHLSKNTTQDNIMDEMVNYGEVLSVNVSTIPSVFWFCHVNSYFT
jgi:hypothetical protein